MTRWILPLAVAGLLALLVVPIEALAQDLHPSRRASPVGIARTHVGDAYVKVTYGRPYMRNRTVFGELVPYGEVWRTGANEDTEITFTEPMLVGGERVEAGTYTLYTVPGEDEWQVRLSPQLGLWALGTLDRDAEPMFTPNVYDQSQDVLRVTAPVTTIEDPIQQFTINLEPVDAGAHLVMQWENAEVRVPLQGAE